MKTILLLWAALAVSACHGHEDGGHGHGEGEPHGHPHPEAESDERPGLSFTHWTETSELFIELPALVRGLESPCAAHVTNLVGFSPLGDGRVRVILRQGAAEERFETDAPTVPGIFRPIVRPSAAGVWRLVVEIRGEDVTADHDLGDVTVYPDAAAARAANPEEPEALGRIAFLKEQQWPIDFGTAPVGKRELRTTMRVAGTLVARAGGEVLVSAPVAGRIRPSDVGFPKLGEVVTAGQTLATIAPRLEAGDAASLEGAVANGALDLRFATSERARIEALRAEGAVPERRVEEAAHQQREVQLSLAAARRRLKQFQEARDASADGEGTVALTAPITGVVTALHRAPGAFVEAGEALIQITDLADVWLEARVPESQLGKLQGSIAASFKADGMDAELALSPEAFVTRGSRVDPTTRTVSLTFEIDNRSLKIPLDVYARVDLVLGESRRVLAVPASAIVDDGGFFVVFVQVEGESFARRVVRLGATDRGFVEVESGLEAGEQVVIDGAWSVKLAASSGSVPSHGHAH